MKCFFKNYDNKGENHQKFQLILILLVFFLILHSIIFLNGNFSFITLLYGPIVQLSINSINENKKTIDLKSLLLCFPFLFFSLWLYFYPTNLTAFYSFIINGFFLIGYSFLINIKENTHKKEIYDNWFLFNKYFLIISGSILIVAGLEIDNDYAFNFRPRIIAICLLFIEIIYVFLILIILNTPKKLNKNNSKTEVIQLPKENNSIEFKKIENYFLTQENYLDPAYNFESFSKDVKINKQELSHFLNKELKVNFYQLLAFYRIELAKKKIKELAHIYTIESLMLECGYHSKSTFNKHFKNIVGKTPSEYRNFHLQKNESNSSF